MVSVLVVGYKAFDLGIFGDKDQRLKIIKAAIRRDLIYLLENEMKKSHLWYLPGMHKVKHITTILTIIKNVFRPLHR